MPHKCEWKVCFVVAKNSMTLLVQCSGQFFVFCFVLLSVQSAVNWKMDLRMDWPLAYLGDQDFN